MSGTPECWTNIITFYYSFHVPAPLGEYPKLLYTPPRGFNFPPSPVSRSIGLIQIVFRLDTWSFRLGCSSLAQLMFGTPTHRRLSLDIRKTLYPFPSVTRIPLASFQTLLYSILSLHPPSRASSLSDPDRRDPRTRTCNLRDPIGAPIPLPCCLWSL